MASTSSNGYEPYSDDQLVAALAADDRGAFTELYNRYWHVLYQLACQKLRDKEMAEELVQELFISLWTKRRTASIRDLKPYLFTALRFSIINHIESRLVHERFVAYYESFLRQPSTASVNTLELEDLTQAIETSLRNLPEKTQQVFRLSRFEQQTIPEIAQHLGLSEKAIEYHLSKALKTVRDGLHQSGLILVWYLMYSR